MSGFRHKIIYNFFSVKEKFDLQEFESFARTARESGATHINVGILPYIYSSFLPDNTDPYASWQNYSIGIFRLMPPPALQKWLPVKESEFLLEIYQQKIKVLKKLGLRAVNTNGVEPCWLPEGVYREHPEWRGAQCELARIASRPYFAASIDNPAILAMYTWSLEQICRRFPEIDEFQFLSNDSGGGISWSSGTYPGINGPVAYRLTGFGKRVSTWLAALAKGAQNAGSEARFNVNSCGFTPTEREAVRPLLRKNTFVGGKNVDSESWFKSQADFGADLWTATWPVSGLSNPADFVDSLQTCYSNTLKENESVYIGMDELSRPLAELIIKVFLEHLEENEEKTVLARTRVLLKVAENLVGKNQANKLLGLWEEVNKGVEAMSSVFDRGMSVTIPWTTTCTRWIIRPLVPKPQELTEAETDYYFKNMFNVASREKNANLCYVLGKPLFNGASAVWMARWNFQKAISCFNSACRKADEIMAESESINPLFKLYRNRVKALEHLTENAKYVIWYQHTLNTSSSPRFGANALDYDDNMQYDQRNLELRKIARSDLDNTAAFIKLLQKSSQSLLALAESAAGESVFRLSPNLIQHLEKKMEIMLNHWQEYEELFPVAREYEFEDRDKDFS